MTASLIDGVEETGYLIQNNEIGQLSYNIHKNQLQKITKLNIKHKTIKLLKDNIGKNLSNSGY